MLLIEKKDFEEGKKRIVTVYIFLNSENKLLDKTKKTVFFLKMQSEEKKLIPCETTQEHEGSSLSEDDMKRVGDVLNYFERVGLDSSKYESWVRNLDDEMLQHCTDDQLAKMFVRGKINTVNDSDGATWFESIGFRPNTALWLQSLVDDGDVDTKENMPFRALLWRSFRDIPPDEQKQIDSLQTGKWGRVRTDSGGSFLVVKMKHSDPNTN